MTIKRVIEAANEFQFECETPEDIAKAEHIRRVSKKFDFESKSYEVTHMADGIDQGPIITYVVLVK